MIGKKHIWTRAEIFFIRKNFNSMTNPQLAKALDLTLTLVRNKCRELGLKHMEMEYWTTEQVRFLKANYKKYGDTELTEMFRKKWKKEKGWSKKHIEKKRRYLNLKRTEAQKKVIKRGIVAKGTYARSVRKMWQTRGVAKEGEIRYWKQRGTERRVPFVKVKGSFVHWARHTWIQIHGPVPKGMNVIFTDGDPCNRQLSNLSLVSNAELSKRNSEISSKGLSDNYVAGIMTHNDPELRQTLKQHPELIQLKRKHLLLNRKINEQQETN